MLSCKEAARLHFESRENPLPLRRRIGLKFHMMMCLFCRRYTRQVRAIEKLVGLYAERLEREDQVASAGLSQGARERLLAALRGE